MNGLPDTRQPWPRAALNIAVGTMVFWLIVIECMLVGFAQ